MTIPPDDDVEVLDLSALIDAHLDAPTQDDFENEIPTVVEVRHVCPGCGGDQFRLEGTDQPPASHAQAWRCGPFVNGKPLYGEGACRGNETWYWCRAAIEYDLRGTLVIISKPGEGGMIVMFFPDRRLRAVDVPNDRRRSRP